MDVQSGSTRNVRRRLRRKLFIQLSNKLRQTGLLLCKIPESKRRELTEENLDKICVRLQHSPRKSVRSILRRPGFQNRQHKLPQTIQDNSSAVHGLQKHDRTKRANFCNWMILQSVHDGEIDSHLSYFPTKFGFTCAVRHVYSQNSRSVRTVSD
jgi:hypothetical protein